MSPRPGSLSARLSTRATVVVAEDEADIAGFLGAYFRASGLDLVHVNPRGPEDVADAVRDNDAACLLLDLNLIGFSGLEVLGAFRADERLASIPVVVVSAYTSAMDRCTQLGARAFVPKPFNVSALFDQVMAIVTGTPSAAVTPKPSDAPAVGADELEDQIGRALLRSHRDHEPVSLVLVRAAAAVAARLNDALPGSAVVGCTGPEEIAVLLPGTAANQAERTVGSAIAGLAEANTIRAGVACAPEHASTIDELYMAADTALAEACDSGRAVATAK